MENEPVPEADALEQDQAVEDEADDVPGSTGNRRSPAERGEVPEADWFEQSIAEPLDDEAR